MPAVSPYQTALALNRPAPTYVPNVEDKERVQAYWTYADIYNNVPVAFAALLRSEDDPKSRRYVPFGRALVEAVNRYLGKDLTWVPSLSLADPAMSDEEMAEVMARMDALFTREEFNTKFNKAKRVMLIKGDSCLQVTADPSKPEGSRIRITVMEPEQYFPIMDAVDKERTIGCYIITLQTSPDGQTTVAQREEYRRMLTPELAAEFGAPLGTVYYRMSFYEQDKWDDRFPFAETDLTPVDSPEWIPATPALLLQMQGYALPASITALPIYHFRNTSDGQFGVSELQGMETLLSGIIQNATDEDMAVALSGLGVYYTDSGHPVNAQGEEEDWVISPATVLELQDGRNFGRVQGISTVDPIQDHVKMLKGDAQQTSGTPDIAVGTVDVQTAESGIALALKMNPVLSKNAEKEDELASKLDQFMYDLLNGWLPAYEGVPPTPLIVNATFGNPLPVDKASEISDMVAMVEAGIVDAEFAREYLGRKLGITFPADLGTRMAAAKQAELDAVGTRLDAEAGALPGETGD